MNPFFTPYPTPHGSIPFDSISLSDIEEAVMKGMIQHEQEIDDLVNNSEPPSYSNTIEALERSGELLDRSTTILFNLLSAETNDELDALSERVSPLLSTHSNKILHNEALFARIKTVYSHYHSDDEQMQTLSREQQTLLCNTYDTFIRNGSNLNDTDKQRFTKLSQELSLLELKFSQNHLKDMNDYFLNITDESVLNGLPETVMETAREESESRGLTGWTFTLHAPCYGPFLTYCENRELRRELYMAYNTLCTHENAYNNISIASEIVNKKRELAQLLNFECYADYVLIKRMAENKERVYQLFESLISAYMPIAQEEVKSVESLAREYEGESFELMPWDFSYYSNKLKERQFNINSEMVRPYLPLAKVKKGVFGLAGDLYGLQFVRNQEIPVYHPDVEAYDVLDESGEYKAILYCDFFPRPSKKSGAWMTSYKEQWKDPSGNDSRPHVSITTNFTKPTQAKPSLLTLGELETFLHEFGHALHGILSETTYKSLNGTNVYWDFVELPSQFMENYAVERDFLRRFAYHYETGEPIPDSLIENIIKSRNFNVAYACMRQVSFGELDMYYHTLTKSFTEDILQLEKQIFDHTRLLPYIPGTCMSVQFSHIMSGGYSAGYYSYKWAEVLDADAYSLFKETGIFNKTTATKFKEHILSRGGTEHPMTLYKRFRGKEPTIDALLERNGIKKQ
jgi:peptidyl-dipeptidase Dcp